MIAACIDRWALCSQSATIRSFSQPRVAIRVIILLIIVWTIIPIHLAVFFSNDSGRCIALPGAYAFFYAIYSLIVIGILPLFLMILFSILAWYNLQKIRSRVTPTGNARNIHIHQRDRDLMKMLSAEVFIYCLTTIPYPINLIYSVSTTSVAAYKSPMRIAVEGLIGYIISPFLNFMYCCAQFYGKKYFVFIILMISILEYAFASAKFRNDFICLILCRQPPNEPTTLHSHGTQSLIQTKVYKHHEHHES